MMFSKLAPRRRGFTLIEMLIVIVVIAILALIVIPRIMGAARRAKESTLRGNLHLVRTAVGHFEADCGVYPNDLDHLLLAATAAPDKGYDAATDDAEAVIPEGSYKGPYLTTAGGVGGNGMPINPFTVEDVDVTASHWTLDKGKVTATVPTSGNTMDGTPYTEL